MFTPIQTMYAQRKIAPQLNAYFPLCAQTMAAAQIARPKMPPASCAHVIQQSTRVHTRDIAPLYNIVIALLILLKQYYKYIVCREKRI